MTFGSPHSHVWRESLAANEATASLGAGSTTSLSHPRSTCQLRGTLTLSRPRTVSRVTRSPPAAPASDRNAIVTTASTASILGTPFVRAHVVHRSLQVVRSRTSAHARLLLARRATLNPT